MNGDKNEKISLKSWKLALKYVWSCQACTRPSTVLDNGKRVARQQEIDLKPICALKVKLVLRDDAAELRGRDGRLVCDACGRRGIDHEIGQLQ